jgi:hypothetical protein
VPVIVISAVDLGKIPRSVPEELNAISIVDRLAKAEDSIRQLQDYVAKNANDIHAVTAKTTKGDAQSRERSAQPTSSWGDLRTTEWNDDDWKTPTESDTVEKPESFAEIVANKSIFCHVRYYCLYSRRTWSWKRSRHGKCGNWCAHQSVSTTSDIAPKGQ